MDGRKKKSKNISIFDSGSGEEYVLLGAKNFQRYTATELKSLKNYRRWLKESMQNLDHLIKGLEKKLSKLKQPLICHAVKIALSNLNEVKEKLNHTAIAFNKSLDLNKGFISTIQNDKLKQLNSVKVDLNRQLFLLSQQHGGPTKLHEAFQKLPELIPLGLKKDIGTEAIRRRIYRYDTKKK
jgi:hypothetical protein